ncbi:MAG TPA: dephospho-CoA kinase [Dissulfurispiraceae bacterium]|nr:dephospho-CoA kinase [Dissulfurispiraceae bacterium]
MIVVGLTGNYGSGKSTVADMFRQLGARTLDADEIVHQLLDGPEVIKEIEEAFGEEIVAGGVVDRKRLAAWVFGDAHARITLEDILHPRVFQRIYQEAARYSSENERILIVEATVIFERGHQGKFEKIITVFVSEETALNRLMAKGVLEEDAKKRLSTQLPVEIKIRGSDFVIDNDRDIEQTRGQVRVIYQTLISLGRQDGNN